tara:strand:+ start:35 stop:250 length:216 start_codon:yes stop_codon:yes gene_type:complete
MSDDAVIEVMVEEVVRGAFNTLDICGPNADDDIAKASHSAVKQLLAIKAHEIVSRTNNLSVSLPDFVEACR